VDLSKQDQVKVSLLLKIKKLFLFPKRAAPPKPETSGLCDISSFPGGLIQLNLAARIR
jgi:hypothetical protein